MARKQEVSRKDYVKINSTVTVRVEPSPEMYENITKKDSDLPNRLKVVEKHSKYGILIKSGQHTYPSVILEYGSVKGLIDNGKIAVVGETDEAGTPEVAEQKALLDEMKDEKVEGKGLEELAEEKAEEPAK